MLHSPLRLVLFGVGGQFGCVRCRDTDGSEACTEKLIND